MGEWSIVCAKVVACQGQPTQDQRTWLGDKPTQAKTWARRRRESQHTQANAKDRAGGKYKDAYVDEVDAKIIRVRQCGRALNVLFSGKEENLGQEVAVSIVFASVVGQAEVVSVKKLCSALNA